MGNAFIMDKGCVKEMHICPCRDCSGSDKEIACYYSYVQAGEEGWRFTKDIKFCPPDIEGVWVCPTCINK